MAIKEIKREWSPCQLDYVKTFLLHSEKDVKDLPKCCVGSKATVSETDNEYFCTESGWKLGSELGGPSEVVILPETVAERFDVEGQVGFILPTPFINNPEFDKTYTVTCNGDVYECKSFDAFHEGPEPIIIGNAGLMGLEDTGEPFLIMLYPSGNYQLPNGTTGYGAILMNPTPESITLSIVEKAETASAGGGGVLVINMSCDLSDDMSTVTNPTKDKTFAEAKAVYDAGGIVVVRLECKSGPMAGCKFDFERTAFMVMGGQSGFMFTMNNAAGPNMINLLSDDSFNIMID